MFIYLKGFLIEFGIFRLGKNIQPEPDRLCEDVMVLVLHHPCEQSATCWHRVELM